MIASIDGATAVAGVSSRLGGPADQALFAVLRSQADVVLVAAGTVRAEHYGPLAVPMAVLSRSCRLDWDSPLFTAAVTPPIVVTVAEAPALERKKAADLADVIIAGERDVDLAAALGALAERGYARVLAEGGPTLNGQLAAAGLLDELCLTVSPLLAGGRCQADPGRPGPAVRVWLADPIAVRAGRIPFSAVPPAIAGPTLPGRVRRGGPEGELPREDVRSVADRHQMLLERGLQDPDDGLPAGVVMDRASCPARHMPPWQPRPCGLSGYSRT
jgi:riboflavin biosynthesis pyrimidine reductase